MSLRHFTPTALMVGLLAAWTPLQAEEYAFDLEAFEAPSPLDLKGFAEMRYERLRLDPDAALYRRSFGEEQIHTLDRFGAAVELEADYRAGNTRLNALFRGSARQDDLASEDDARFHQAYLAHTPAPQYTFEAGKRTLRWGKGYAWNPVAFLERPKDPLDPELSREGFVLATADFIRSGEGDLRTVAFTPAIVPVTKDVNTAFGEEQAVNFAAKLYLLYRDVDFDLLYRTGGSRSEAFGIDFAANLAPHFEVHGEWAYFPDDDRAGSNGGGAHAALLGLRYLTEAETTYIAEYYHDERGLGGEDLRRFFDRLEEGLTPTDGAPRRTHPGRRYGYLRVSQKDAFGRLYLNAALTAIVNLDDGSHSLTPELLYTGITNLELRLRLGLNRGGAGTDFGERASDGRLELRARYFF